MDKSGELEQKDQMGIEWEEKEERIQEETIKTKATWQVIWKPNTVEETS